MDLSELVGRKRKELDEIARAKLEAEVAHRRLRDLLNNMPVGIILLKVDGSIIANNPRALEILGHEDGSQLENNISLLTPGLDIVRLKETVETQGKKVDMASDYVVKTDGGGKKIRLEFSFNEFYSTDGFTLMATFQDVTERYEIEQFKRDFLAMVSHDLRTPLTAVQIILSMLQKGVYGPLSEPGQVRVGKAFESTERMLSLINQLLDIEKLESGTMDVTIEAIDLNIVFAQSLDSVRSFAESHGVTLSCDHFEPRVMADADRIVQVLINLLSNAVKFSPKGSTVKLGAKHIQTQAEITVADQGRGIPAEKQSAIFERFKQVDRSDETVKRGTGLGLAICKTIIESHKGTIGVLSKEGEGSTFWFRLDLAV